MITRQLGRSPKGRQAYPSARSNTTLDSCSGPTASKRGSRSTFWTTDPGGGGGKASSLLPYLIYVPLRRVQESVDEFFGP